jgi:tetratricopeptide (TPR) repeat protein
MKKLFKKIITAFFPLIVTIAGYAQTTATEWFDKANKLYDDEKYKEAAFAYDKATLLDPKNENAFYKAGWCYNDLNKFDNAIDRLKKAVALNKNDQFAWQELGYAYKKTGKNEEALPCLKKAVELKPDYSLAYKQLGDVYQNLDKTTEAITAYKKCNSLDSENDDACYNLGYIYNGLAEYDNALDWLNKANAIRKSVDVYNEIGFACYKLKKNNESIEAYQGALKLNEKSGTAYKGIGDVYRLNFTPAKVTEALENYTKAIEYNPKSSGSQYGLGWCYNEKSRFEEAITTLKTSIELLKTFAPAYAELGYAQYMTGKYTDGLSTFKLGIEQDKENKLCRYYSGLIYIKQNDKTNATRIYNELKPLDDKLAEKLLVKIKAM